MQRRNPLPLFNSVERRSLEIILFPSFFFYSFLPCPFNTIVNGVERRSRESIQASARRATHAMQPVLNFYFYLLFIILGYRATSHPCHATCVKILFLFLFFLGYRSTSLYAMQPWLD